MFTEDEKTPQTGKIIGGEPTPWQARRMILKQADKRRRRIGTFIKRRFVSENAAPYPKRVDVNKKIPSLNISGTIKKVKKDTTNDTNEDARQSNPNQ